MDQADVENARSIKDYYNFFTAKAKYFLWNKAGDSKRARWANLVRSGATWTENLLNLALLQSQPYNNLLMDKI